MAKLRISVILINFAIFKIFWITIYNEINMMDLNIGLIIVGLILLVAGLVTLSKGNTEAGYPVGGIGALLAAIGGYMVYSKSA